MDKCGITRHRCRDASSPSFSSSLLDAIYRSIDDGGGVADTCRSTKKANCHGNEPDHISIRKKCFSVTETENEVLRRRGCSAATAASRDYDHRTSNYKPQLKDRHFLSSTSTSSVSSYGGFSSTDAESIPLPFRPKSIHVAPPPPPARFERATPAPEPKKAKQECSIRSRFRSSRIYGEIKKAKPPVSPGRRLASFLNTLFASTGHAKKAKISSSPSSSVVTTGRDNSTCSTASSYSRSCLSKTPSSRGKPAGGAKRSVSFCPVSVIVDEDYRPCGQKSVYDVYSSGRRDHEAEEVRKIAEKGARDVGKRGYNGKRALIFEEEEEDDDDMASDSSSDLFELENLTAVSCGRYTDELPVYETTHIGTNLAIAQGLIV